MEPEDSSPCSKQPNNVPIRAKLITVRPSDTISDRSILILFFHLRLSLTSGLPPLGFQNKTLYAFLFLVCATCFPPLIILHFINTNNNWSRAKIMKIIINQIFPSSCHFLHVRSQYLPHHPILEYLQPVFVRQHRRPSFTPICNIWCNYSSLIKMSSE